MEADDNEKGEEKKTPKSTQSTRIVRSQQWIAQMTTVTVEPEDDDNNRNKNVSGRGRRRRGRPRKK